MAITNVLDGATCLFWEDLWNFRVPRSHNPEFFSFVKSNNIFLKAARDATGPEVLCLPILVEALLQATHRADTWSL